MCIRDYGTRPITHILISNSRKDAETVLKLRAELAQQGCNIWLDQDNTPNRAESRSENQAAIDSPHDARFVFTGTNVSTA